MPESYVSCLWLEGGIVFHKGYLTVCCQHHSDGKKGCPFICRFDGGELPLDKIFMARDELRRNVRDGVDCACSNCPSLAHMEWPEGKKEFRQIAIANFSHCNLDCYYCENHTPPEKENGAVRAAYDILPIITGLYEKGMAGPMTSFAWGGGEPTLIHEFEPLLRYLIKREAPIHIPTNATILSPAILEGLTARKTIKVTCTVDAGTPETYAAIKKRDSFATVWRNVAEYAKANDQAVAVKFIMLPENMSEREITAFIGQCRAAGIKNIRISRDTQRPLPEDGPRLAAFMIHLALKENMDVDIFPTMFGPADCARMMHYVHQIIVDNGSSVDFSRLFRLSHIAFGYLRFNSVFNT